MNVERRARAHLVGRLLPVALLIATATAAAAADPPAITGRVLGDDGFPLPGATIELLALGPDTVEPAAVAVTDDGGRYRLDAPSAGAWRVRASGPGHAPSALELTPLIEPVRLPDVRLAADVGLTVRVVGPDGEPVEGATAVLTPEESAGFGPDVADWAPGRRSATTDAEGHAVLPRGAAERARLTVAADGLAPTTRDRLPGNTVRVRLDAGVRWTFRVVDGQGTPVAGVESRLPGSGILRGTTGDDGVVRVVLPRSGTAGIAFVVPDGGRARVRPSGRPAGDDAPRVVRVPSTRLVAGRVVDVETRRAIPGAVVWTADAPERAVVTDRSGGFVLRRPLGERGWLHAAAPGYLPSERWPLTVTEDGDPGPSVPLTPGAIVEGKVVDDDGRAIEGAVLRQRPKPTGGGMRIEISSGGAARPDAVSDEDGAFRVGPLDPDRPWILSARADDRAEGSVDVVGLEPRRTRRGVRIVVPEGRTASGRVEDGGGAPIPGAEVTWTPSSPAGRGGFHVIGPGSGTPRTAVTDTDGRYAIRGLEPGTGNVEVVRSGFAAGRREGVELLPDRDETTLDPIVLLPGHPVAGRVVDENGGPIEGAEVRARAEGGGGMMFVLAGGSVPDDPADAITGPDGWFTVDDRPPDVPVTLAVAREGYLEETAAGIAVPQTEPLEFELQPASTLSGVVLDPDGAPVAGAGVSLERTVTARMGNRQISAITQMENRTDADGRFRFERQRPGTVALTVQAPGWKTTSLDGVEIPRGADRDDVEVRLEPGAVFVGRVTAADGRPVAGASVREVAAGGSGPAAMMGRGGATTDGEGFYRLEGIEPGPRSIEAVHPSYVRTVRDVEARPGRNGLDFEFEGGQAVRGIVVDPSGAPVPGAWVGLTPAGRRWGGPEAIADGDGRFDIPGVADGEYTLRASAEGFGAATRGDPIRVEGTPVEGLVLDLAPGATLTGRVLGIEPERLGEVAVEAWSLEGHGFSNGTVSPSTGEYRVEGAGPGRWRVEGTLARDGRAATTEVTVPEGADEGRGDLEFGGGLTLSGRATLAGRPFADAMVYAAGTDVLASVGGRTDRDGRFRLQGLEPGTYRIDLRQWSTGIAHEHTVEVTSDLEIDIELPTARVAGRVVDAVDRAPVAGARISLTPPDGDPDAFGFGPGGVTDVNGTFRIENVPDGTWRLVAQREGYATDAREIVVREAADVAGIDVRLDPTEGLTLKVLTPSGAPPTTVTVAVLDPAGRSVESGPFATGEGGTVRLSRVPPGGWDVLLQAPGTGTAAIAAQAPGAAVEVRLPEPTSLEVVVPELQGAGTTATVVLVDSGGRPFRRLEWYGGASADLRMSGGSLRLDALPPETWTVRVTAADGRTWNGSATTSPGTVARVRLE